MHWTDSVFTWTLSCYTGNCHSGLYWPCMTGWRHARCVRMRGCPDGRLLSNQEASEALHQEQRRIFDGPVCRRGLQRVACRQLVLNYVNVAMSVPSTLVFCFINSLISQSTPGHLSSTRYCSSHIRPAIIASCAACVAVTQRPTDSRLWHQLTISDVISRSIFMLFNSRKQLQQ